jgi:C2 domain
MVRGLTKRRLSRESECRGTCPAQQNGTLLSLPCSVDRNSVYRSKHITDHLNPFWDNFTLNLEELCYGDLSWPIKITIFDHNDRRKHKEIGSCESTIQEMTQRISIRGNADRERAFEIMKEGKTKTRGLIVVLQAEVQLEGGDHRETMEM